MASLAKQGYRADIDGLRAVAVAAVVLYHAGVAGVGGGYVGVDIFFVISGYLITRNIAAEIAEGRFTFAAFYERRARRIFPALFAMLLVTTAVALALFTPEECLPYARSLIGATLGFGNMYFRGVASGAGYFDDHADPQILLHTWSLGVEEQFYVLLPLVLLALWRIGNRRPQWVLAALAAMSFAWAVVTLGYKPNYTFYNVFPRAWELLVGSLLALAPAVRAPRLAREGAAVARLAAALYAIVAFDKATSFPGPNALYPCLGAALLIWSGTTRDGAPTIVARVLTLRPVVFLGLVSYSLYLWHWPVLVVGRIVEPAEHGGLFVAAMIAISLGLATVSYWFVETPFRHGRGPAGRRRVFAASAAGTLAMLAVASFVVHGDGLRSRVAAQSLALLDANAVRAAEVIPPACLNWRKPLREIGDLSLCPIAGPGPRKVVFWGDSHVAQLRPVVAKMAAEGVFGDRGVLFPIAAGCVLSNRMNRTQSGYACPTFMTMAKAIAARDDVDTVFIGFAAHNIEMPGAVCFSTADGRCTEAAGLDAMRHAAIEELTGIVRALRARNKSVVVMLPLPTYDRDVPQMVRRAALFRSRGLDALADHIEGGLRRHDFAPWHEDLANALMGTGALLFDGRRSLCDGDACRYAVGGVSLYSDDSHIAESQVGLFHDELADVFRKVYQPRPAATLSAKADTLLP